MGLSLFCVSVSPTFCHFRSDRLANRLIRFVSTRRISRHLSLPKFPPLGVQKKAKTVILTLFGSVNSAAARAVEPALGTAAIRYR